MNYPTLLELWCLGTFIALFLFFVILIFTPRKK